MMTESFEQEMFLDMAQTWFFCSYRGLNKHLDRNSMSIRATKLAADCWNAIYPLKADMTPKQWAKFRNDAPAASANLLGAHPELDDKVIIQTGIEDANDLWDKRQKAPF